MSDPQFPRYADGPEDRPPHQQQQEQQPVAYPPAYGHGYPSADGLEVNALAISALISGGVGFGPLAIGLGIAALARIRRTGERGTWMAVTGIVLGALETIVIALFVVLVIWAANSAGQQTLG